jgi:multiple antibiotic resistance protein
MLQEIFAMFFTFFIVVDPLGVIPLYVSLTGFYGEERKKKTIRRALLTAGAVLLFFIFLGKGILVFLGIKTGSFFIAGGILLFIVSMDMLFAAPKRAKTSDRERDSDDVSIFPLGIPIIAGPGTITTILLYVSRENADILTVSALIIVLAVVLVLAGIGMYLSGYFVRALGNTGLSVIERIMGLVLSGLSVQFIYDGLVKLGVLFS